MRRAKVTLTAAFLVPSLCRRTVAGTAATPKGARDLSSPDGGWLTVIRFLRAAEHGDEERASSSQSHGAGGITAARRIRAGVIVSVLLELPELDHARELRWAATVRRVGGALRIVQTRRVA